MANKITKEMLQNREVMLQNKIDYLLRKSESLATENTLLQKLPRLESGQIQTMFAAFDKIVDALAHVITELSRRIPPK